jgi:hypothetical protein
MPRSPRRFAACDPYGPPMGGLRVKRLQRARGSASGPHRQDAPVVLAQGSSARLPSHVA